MARSSDAFHLLAGVRLEIRNIHGKNIKYQENPHQLNHGRCHFISRAIHATPGDDVEIRLNFSDEFELLGWSGVRITLGIGHTELDLCDLSTSQSYWIDADNLREEHVFRSFSTWESDHGKAEAIPLTVPVPDGER